MEGFSEERVIIIVGYLRLGFSARQRVLQHRHRIAARHCSTKWGTTRTNHMYLSKLC